MQIFASGAAAIGLAALALAFHKEPGEHFAKPAKAAHQAPAQIDFQIGA